MENEVVKNREYHPHTSNSTSLRERHIIGDGLVKPPQSSTDFGLHWGNRKRLRCIKNQVKNDHATVTRTTVRRVNRFDDGVHSGNGHFNLRQRPASSARLLRNTEGGTGMKGHNSNYNNNNNNNNNNINDINNNNINNDINHNHNHGSKYQSNGGVRELASPNKMEKKFSSNHENLVINGGSGGGGSETKNGSSLGGVNDVVWPPKLMIALTNKEKEEDFLAIKGSKLPQRPKKRAKFIQRTLNLVSPGGWLCDLTLERYEVREKKISKKRPRGLKAMGNYMESDSE